MNNEIKVILKQLEDSIKEPVVGGEDYYTGEGWEMPNFFCLDPTTNDCKILYEYITKLQNNWNELKKFVEKDVERWEQEEQKWIEQGFMKFGGEANNKIIFKKVLNKMQELEGENNNEEESNSK